MREPKLHPKLPVSESFDAEYLEYYRMLPLDLTSERLLVAVAGAPHGDAIGDLRDSYILGVGRV